MRFVSICFFALLLTSCLTVESKYPRTGPGAAAAISDGEYSQGVRILESLADDGDSKAMTTLGLLYYQGRGVDQNYEKAMDWHLKAMENSDPDALNNIGVLYRDGLGVTRNKKIAYTLFLFTHMASIGDAGTQMRANRNLRREVDVLAGEDTKEALCYTWKYVLAYVRARGELEEIPSNVRPENGAKRLKDFGWWTPSESERLRYDCPPPWN